MTIITKEQVHAVSDLKAGYTLGHADVAILNELARIALASLEAEKNSEPVAFINGAWTLVYYRPPKELGLNIGDKLYAAPTATVSVPDEMTIADVIMEIDAKDADRWTGRIGFQKGWNACRAAMLQGAERVSNRDELQDGWVACSERMPEVGKTLALYGRRVKEGCDQYVDEGYLGKNGLFYFFDWEGGPRIGDCDPGDKAEVTHWMYWELPSAPQQEDK